MLKQNHGRCPKKLTIFCLYPKLCWSVDSVSSLFQKFQGFFAANISAMITLLDSFWKNAVTFPIKRFVYILESNQTALLNLFLSFKSKPNLQRLFFLFWTCVLFWNPFYFRIYIWTLFSNGLICFWHSLTNFKESCFKRWLYMFFSYFFLQFRYSTKTNRNNNTFVLYMY